MILTAGLVAPYHGQIPGTTASRKAPTQAGSTGAAPSGASLPFDCWGTVTLVSLDTYSDPVNPMTSLIPLFLSCRKSLGRLSQRLHWQPKYVSFTHPVCLCHQRAASVLSAQSVLHGIPSIDMGHALSHLRKNPSSPLHLPSRFFFYYYFFHLKLTFSIILY